MAGIDEGFGADHDPMTLPPVAVTCGEPAGIGLELTEKAWQELRGGSAFFLIGDLEHLPGRVPCQEISAPEEAADVFRSALPVLPLAFNGALTHGNANPSHAPGVIEAIGRAVDLAKSGRACAVCTNPINKKALIDGAGFAYPGHTEFLAALGGQCDVVMMLVSDQLRVVPATIHIPLSQVPTALTAEVLETCLRVTQRGLIEDFGIADPEIAVAGLNPHAGEGGAMGAEDGEMIAPVLNRLMAEGMHLTGPLPADTMFHARARETYDAAVCMYHDQALIPIKTLDFDRGVNVTLGLPFIRTSPDHGTAFDIAGKGLANPQSLIEAIRMAASMGTQRWQR